MSRKWKFEKLSLPRYKINNFENDFCPVLFVFTISMGVVTWVILGCKNLILINLWPICKFALIKLLRYYCKDPRPLVLYFFPAVLLLLYQNSDQFVNLIEWIALHWCLVVSGRPLVVDWRRVRRAGEVSCWHIDFVMGQVAVMLIEFEVTILYKEVHIARQMIGHPRGHHLFAINEFHQDVEQPKIFFLNQKRNFRYSNFFNAVK